MKRKTFICVATPIILISVITFGLQCTKEQTAGVVSTGSNVSQVICAVLLDEQSVEHEICDTGAKLGALLGSLLRSNSLTQEHQPQPTVGPVQSAQPAQSAQPVSSSLTGQERQPQPTAGPPFEQPVTFKSNLKLVRLYIKP